MTKYEQLISKIQTLKTANHCSEFSTLELELIANALETLQVLEIIVRLGVSQAKLENNQKNSG